MGTPEMNPHRQAEIIIWICIAAAPVVIIVAIVGKLMGWDQ